MVSSMNTRRAQSGATMIEILVTLVIIAFGLLGMAGLQMRMQVSEIEAYQRSQALLLLEDMASRMATNRNNISQYLATTTYGGTSTCPASTSTTAMRDLKEWCEALQGASVTQDGNKAGGLIGGRGCIKKHDSDYMVTVVWQGMTPISAPPDSVPCGAGEYNSANCGNDLCRRYVTTIIRIATLL